VTKLVSNDKLDRLKHQNFSFSPNNFIFYQGLAPPPTTDGFPLKLQFI